MLSLRGGCTGENSVIPVTLSVDREIEAAAYSVTINFDPEKLEFTSASDKTGVGTFYYNAVSEDSIRLVWSNSSDTQLSGSILTAAFKTRGGTAGKTAPVQIGYCVIGSEDMSEIPFEAHSAKITISEDFVWGDADCSGETDIADVIALEKSFVDPDSYPLEHQGLMNCDTDNSGVVDIDDIGAIFDLVSSQGRKAE